MRRPSHDEIPKPVNAQVAHEVKGVGRGAAFDYKTCEGGGDVSKVERDEAICRYGVRPGGKEDGGCWVAFKHDPDIAADVPSIAGGHERVEAQDAQGLERLPVGELAKGAQGITAIEVATIKRRIDLPGAEQRRS
jgi:hypothetical protein